MPNSNSNFYNSNGQPMTQAAYFALAAALRYKTIGRDAAIRYGIKRGSTLRLITLARQLLAVDQAKQRDNDLDFSIRLSQAAGLLKQ